MLFKPKYSLAITSINRILQTSLGQQISSTGNISESMFDFIDENKYLLTNNRVPFIQHESKNTTFEIEDSCLPYYGWVTEIYSRLISSIDNVYVPFTILEKSKDKNKSLKRNIVDETPIKNECNDNDDTDYDRKKNNDCDIDAVTRINIESKILNDDDVLTIKRRKIEESSDIFHDIKKNRNLIKDERIDAIKALKTNTFVEYIEELAHVFKMSDGEYLLKRLSDEQKQCLYSILGFAYPNDFPNKHYTSEKDDYDDINPFYKIFIIEGSAGCGKSAIIESLNFYSFKEHNKYTKLLYITQTNVLCQSMHKRCFYNENMQYLTFFKFLDILGLNYYNKKQLLLNCDALKIDTFQHTFGSDFLKNIKNVIKLPPMCSNNNTTNNNNTDKSCKENNINSIHARSGYKSGSIGIVDDDTYSSKYVNVNDDGRPRLFIIFDEVYTLSSGQLSLFLFIVRCLKLKYPILSIYCILIGDKHQMRPFTKIENVKLEVIKEQEQTIDPCDIKDEFKDGEDELNDSNRLENNKFINNKLNEEIKAIKREEDINTLSIISQRESVTNATRFYLTQQFRIVDEEYNDFVDRVRNSENRVDIGIQLLNDIHSKWGDKINNILKIKYPIKEIKESLEGVDIKEYRKIAKILTKTGLFKKTLDTTIFCFTNEHAHYYNLALACSYWNQIIADDNKNKKNNDFIAFSIIYSFNYIKFISDDYKIKDLINNSNYLINILPLIRFCPYKVLSSNYPVARLSIVYILDWIINEKRNITNIIVYSPDTNLLFSMLPGRFEMNLFKIPLFGFPLQFAFSSTFASSQGLTLNNKIAISCTNISNSELYVCLTRIKSSKDLVRIY